MCIHRANAHKDDVCYAFVHRMHNDAESENETLIWARKCSYI